MNWFNEGTPEEHYREAERRIEGAHRTESTSLNLSSLSELDCLPDSLARLTQLTTLNLSKCPGVTTLDPLARLTQLTTLNLSRCKGVTKLDPLARLTALTTLDLSWCRGVTTLDPLARLTQLTTLDLSGCRGVATLDPLARLTQLTTLNLSVCTGLTTLKPLTSLTDLTTLNLTWCPGVTTLDPLAETLKNLKTLRVHRSGISLPQELIDSEDAQAIFAYVRSKGKRPLHRAKLMIVGEGKAGKTHLRHRLFPETSVDRRYFNRYEQRTIIEPRQLEPRTIHRKTIQANLWDLGGQQHLHAVHRFFLGADHCGYIIVFDATRNSQANRVNYWLRFVAHHGRSSKHGVRCPVTIVLNKCDEVALATANDPIRTAYDNLLESLQCAKDNQWHGANVIDNAWIKIGYRDPDAVGFMGHDERRHMTTTHNEGMDTLERLVDVMLARLPGADVSYEPAFHTWLGHFEEHFQHDATTELPIDEKAPLGTITKENAARVLNPWEIQAMHALGAVFSVGDRCLANQQRSEFAGRVFNPTWVRKFIYELVRHELPDQRFISESDLETYWAKLTNEDWATMLGLAELARVAIPCQLAGPHHPKTRTWFIPDKLSPRESLETGDGWTLWFELKLLFVSDRIVLDVLTTVATDLHLGDTQTYFRDQITLKRNGCEIVVNAIANPPDGQEPRIAIGVRATDAVLPTVIDQVMAWMQKRVEACVTADLLIDISRDLSWLPHDRRREAKDNEVQHKLREWVANSTAQRWMSLLLASTEFKIDEDSLKRACRNAENEARTILAHCPKEKQQFKYGIDGCNRYFRKRGNDKATIIEFARLNNQ
jgi:hypothetical protein